MNNNTCNKCKIEFKYPSLLKRHIDKKKSCVNSIIDNAISNNMNITNTKHTKHIDNNKTIDNTISNDTNTIITTHKLDNIKDIIKKNLCYTDILLLFSSIIDEKQNKINDKDNIDKDNINKDNINKDNISNIKIYNCKHCNLNFSSSSSLCNHNKLNRCKGISENIKEQDNFIIESRKKSETTLNDILGITINDSDNFNITNNNNNSITNNNNITNNIITINAFGCENLDNITTKQFTSVFKNFKHLHKMLYELGNIVYKNNNNMNFTKNNMNKNIVTYLSRDMEVKQISEREFIKEFEENIKKLCIELFHIHKNDISLNDLIDYMKSFLLYFDILQEKKINHIELKEQLKSIMDYVFRDENINEVIKKIKVELQNNEELKIQCLKNNNSRLKAQKQRLNEYYFLPNEDNKDEKHLCKVKDISFNQNTDDRKNILKNSISKKHSNKLETLENNKNTCKDSIKLPIVVNFDSETGSIIDDRE